MRMDKLSWADGIISLWKQYDANKDGNSNQRRIAKESLKAIVSDCDLAIADGHTDQWFINQKQWAETGTRPLNIVLPAKAVRP